MDSHTYSRTAEVAIFFSSTSLNSRVAVPIPRRSLCLFHQDEPLFTCRTIATTTAITIAPAISRHVGSIRWIRHGLESAVEWVNYCGYTVDPCPSLRTRDVRTVVGLTRSSNSHEAHYFETDVNRCCQLTCLQAPAVHPSRCVCVHVNRRACVCMRAWVQKCFRLRGRRVTDSAPWRTLLRWVRGSVGMHDFLSDLGVRVVRTRFEQCPLAFGGYDCDAARLHAAPNRTSSGSAQCSARIRSHLSAATSL